MGRPILDPEQIPINVAGSPLDQLQHLNQQLIHFSAVSMGNPHCVIFNSDLDPKEWGPKLEQWELFPKRTNVEFVSVVNSKEVAVTVWERGAGFTKACGTGACATVVAGALLGHCERQTKVQLPGGVLKIDWKKDSDEVFMTGPSQFVAVGEVQVP
jgi:diaminopimelate epimerase